MQMLHIYDAEDVGRVLKYLSEINSPWLSSWNGYSQDWTMATYCDHFHSIFDEKAFLILTTTELLNDGYNNGELVMVDEETKLNAEDMMVFPLCFLYPQTWSTLLNPESVTRSWRGRSRRKF